MTSRLKAAFAEIRRIITYVCEHPAHLQRLSIIGSGMALYPALFGMVGVLVYFGTHPAVHALAVIPIFGNITYGLLILFGLVILALLNILRSFKASLPAGASIELDIADSKDPE